MADGDTPGESEPEAPSGRADGRVARLIERLEGAIPPLVALAIAVLAVSTSAILVRFSDAPSLAKAFYRVLFTVALLGPFAFGRYGGRIRTLSGRDLSVAGLAGMALAVHFASWFESLQWTSVAASVTLVQAQPLFVAGGAALVLDERVTRRMAVGIAVAISGMAIMSLGEVLTAGALSGTRPLYGNALALVGAVMAAAYVLAGRSLRQHVPLVPYVLVVYTACALSLLGLALIEGVSLAGYPLEEWGLFLGMAIGPGLFGHTLINWALAHVESSVVSVSLLGEPIGSTVLALLLLSEVPTPVTIVGGAVVLGGIYVTTTGRSADRRADPDGRSSAGTDADET